MHRYRAASAQLAATIDHVPSTSEPLARRVLAANVSGRSPEQSSAIIRFACRPKLSDHADESWPGNWFAPGLHRRRATRSTAIGGRSNRDQPPMSPTRYDEAMPKLIEVAADKSGWLDLGGRVRDRRGLSAPSRSPLKRQAIRSCRVRSRSPHSERLPIRSRIRRLTLGSNLQMS